MSHAQDDLKCDVLLVTVTDVETRSLLAEAKLITDQAPEKIFGKERTYFNLGHIGSARTFLVRSEMGSDTVGGSTVTARDAIWEANPGYVVMLGIAFGVDSKKQCIGDILVSRQLQGYELQRVSSKKGDIEIQSRGDKATASNILIDRFRTASLEWTESNVDFCLMLSGQKLIDNMSYRKKLLEFFPEAAGGEMEGTGLYSASQSKFWIVVKSICDFADGKKAKNKEENQELASKNAAKFTLFTLKQGGMVKKKDFEPLKSIKDAQPDRIDETLWSNLLPAIKMPRFIYEVPINVNLRFDSKKEISGYIKERQREARLPVFTPAYRVSNNNIISFFGENKENHFFDVIDKQRITKILVSDYCQNDDNGRIIISLINMAISRHMRRMGLINDNPSYGHRYFFPQYGTEPITQYWQPFKKRSPRTVVKSYDQENIHRHWLHQACVISPIQIASKYFLKIKPTWLLTDDGTTPLGGKDVGRIIIKWTGTERNRSIFYHILYWSHVLKGPFDIIIIRCGSQKMIVSPQPATINMDWGIMGDSFDVKRTIDDDAASINITEGIEIELDAEDPEDGLSE